MLENFVSTFLPQIAELNTVLVLFIVGANIVEIRNGYPFIRGSFASRNRTLVGIAVAGILTFFVIVPILEKIILDYLTANISLAIPSLLVLSGVAILVFDAKMVWNFKKHGSTLLAIGIGWTILIS